MVNGAYSSRRLYVNGRNPYKEAEEIRFHYDNSFQTQVFGDGETAYRIPLKKGINEIKLEATLGSLSSLLMEVDDCIAALNSIYMKILMITGPTPDQLRDYQFDKQIPDVLRNLKEQADALEDLYSRYVAITGQNGQEAQTLKKAYLQAREMTDDPGRDRPAVFHLFLQHYGAGYLAEQRRPAATGNRLSDRGLSRSIPCEKRGGLFQSLLVWRQAAVGLLPARL